MERINEKFTKGDVFDRKSRGLFKDINDTSANNSVSKNKVNDYSKYKPYISKKSLSPNRNSYLQQISQLNISGKSKNEIQKNQITLANQGSQNDVFSRVGANIIKNNIKQMKNNSTKQLSKNIISDLSDKVKSNIISSDRKHMLKEKKKDKIELEFKSDTEIYKVDNELIDINTDSSIFEITKDEDVYKRNIELLDTLVDLELLIENKNQLNAVRSI